ncbi:hypothetical protein DENIS_5163 [Desulfonema ishimotonii]|uniref:TolC family protein n=1 Tax=Desulfonema ishimotonii TaxID=45657 RepID=A0A401G4R5_9BACT|nr:TolC family protein [Desulfonema ishimotonii]GBC64145.1 hypothetical protein DENIS_5163 [Desulfonema ishimotonii]
MRKVQMPAPFLLILIRLFFITGILLLPVPSAADPTITVAIVRDGPSPYFDRRIEDVIREIGQLREPGHTIRIKDVPAFNADWQAERIPRVLANALKDPRVDIVYTAGFLVTEAASQPRMRLTKPVVAGIIHDAGLLGLPSDEAGHSRKRNLAFNVLLQNIGGDIAVFRQLTPFHTLHLLADDRLLLLSKRAQACIAAIEQEYQITIRTVPVGTSAQAVLDQLGPETGAVFLTPFFRMTPSETRKMISGINRKKIPSFAMLGRPLVEQGVLAGQMPHIRDRMARRIALNIRQIAQGESPNRLSVRMIIPRKLVINLETADQIGYSPDIATLIGETEFIGSQSPPPGAPLTMEQAMNMAAAHNVGVAVETAAVESSRQTRERARSHMRPQVYGTVQYQQIDGDRAENAMGLAPEKKTTAGATLSQMIYDDGIITGYRVADLQYQGGQYNRDAVRLDVTQAAGQGFLRCLSARALHKIAQENLRLTRKNLQLATVRQRVGRGGPDERLRWEAEEAQRKSAVIGASRSVESAFVGLNQILNQDQNRRWQLRDIPVGETATYFLGQDLSRIITRMTDLNRFMRLSVDLALENAPELAVLDRQVESLTLTLDRLKRRYYTPTVRAEAAYVWNGDISGKGAGSVLSGLTIPGLDLPDAPDDHEWGVSLKLTLPLFEGGGRAADVGKARADLMRLQYARIQTRQMIEQRVRTSVYALSRSWPDIFLARKAADRARKNLRIIQDRYGQGKASITDLLNAQTHHLRQEQNASLSIYRYLDDEIEFQRAIAWFRHTRSEAEKEEMIRRISEYMNTEKTPAVPGKDGSDPVRPRQ